MARVFRIATTSGKTITVCAVYRNGQNGLLLWLRDRAACGIHPKVAALLS
jgi:hypothetical protein